MPPPDTPPAQMPPGEFAARVLRVGLWSKQQEVLAALTQQRRVAVKSGNGLGKGFCAAVAVLWFLYVHPEAAIVLSTAPTFRQVRHILWRQIHRLYRPAAKTLGGKMLDTRWELADDRYAMGLSADSADQFQGFHSPNMFIVVDEAEGVSDEIYEAIEAVMTSSDPLLLLIGNPTTITGAFRRAFYEERALYHPITISALDSPNVQSGQTPVPGLTTARWVEERREIWGEENPIYRARVLGEFPDQAEDTLLSLTDVEAAARPHPAAGSRPESGIQPVPGPADDGRESAAQPADSVSTDGRESAAQPADSVSSDGRESAAQPADSGSTDGRESADATAAPVILAVDVARYGSDRSVILRRRGQTVEDIRTFRRLDTMQLTGWVAAAIREWGGAEVYVDEIGVGAGVVDRLKEQGFRVRGVNVARAARQDGLFANLRAEGYWRLRELFAAGQIVIPRDHQLIGELAALRYSYDSQGRIQMESKEAMRQRGLPSPDKADALMLAFLPPTNRMRLWT